MDQAGDFVHHALSGDEENVYGYSGYIGAQKRDDKVIRNKRGQKIRYRINCKSSQTRKLGKSG